MAGGGNHISYLDEDGVFHRLVQEEILFQGDGDPFNVQYLSSKRISRNAAYSGLLLRAQHQYRGHANALLLNFREIVSDDGIVYDGWAHPFTVRITDERAFRERNPNFPELH
jgi:hypothetical protein